MYLSSWRPRIAPCLGVGIVAESIWPFFLYGPGEGWDDLWAGYQPEVAASRVWIQHVVADALRVLEELLRIKPLPISVEGLVREAASATLSDVSEALAQVLAELIDPPFPNVCEEAQRDKLLLHVSRVHERIPRIAGRYRGLNSPDSDGWISAATELPRACLVRCGRLKYELHIPAGRAIGSQWLLERIRHTLPDSKVKLIVSSIDGTRPVSEPGDWSGGPLVVWGSIELRRQEDEPVLTDLIQWWLVWSNPEGPHLEFREFDEHYMGEPVDGLWEQCEEARKLAETEGNAHLWPLYTRPLYPRLPPGSEMKLLPYPFSHMYIHDRQRCESQAEDALEGLLHSAERVVAFAAACYCSLLEHEHRAKAQELLNSWRHMSFGSWLKVLQYEPEDGESRLLGLWFALPGHCQVLLSAERLLRLRNVEGGLHPFTALPYRKKAELVQEYWPDLEILYFFLGMLFAKWKLVVPEVSRKGSVHLRYLEGATHARVDPAQPWPVLDPTIEIGQPALLAGEGTLMPLFPLLLWEECPTCQLRELFFFTRREKQDAVYASFTTHHEFRSGRLAGVLADHGFF